MAAVAGMDRTFCGRVARGVLAGAALALGACASNDVPPPPSTTAPVAAPAATSVYTVQRGDTLTAIARGHGLRLAELARLNGLADPNRLSLGQRLVLPVAPVGLGVASARPAPPAVECPPVPVAAAPAKPRRGTPQPLARAGPPPVSSPPPSTPAAPPLRSDHELVRVDAWIAEGEAHLRGARFEEAIETAHKARAALARLPGAEANARTPRLEILAASAEVALGHTRDAAASFTRALGADPALRLDVASVSPKVVRAFDETRKGLVPPSPAALIAFDDLVASDGSTTGAARGANAR